MRNFLYQIARKFWPELEAMNDQRRLVGVGDVVVFLAICPLAFAGLFWLVRSTDVQKIADNGLQMAMFLGLILLFNRVSYFFIVEIRSDRYGSADGSLSSMLQWAAVLIFGPTALWLSVISSIANYLWTWRQPASKAARWNQSRSLVMELSVDTLAYLVALVLYLRWGGMYPLPELSLTAAAPAMAAIVVQFVMTTVIWSGYAIYAIWIQRELTESMTAPAFKFIVRFLTLALGLPVLAHPFAIIVAGIYTQNGLGIFSFLMIGLLLVAYLARQLSWAAESSRQQSRQLEKLDRLGRDILDAPPDASTLKDELLEHVPGMFPSGRVLIWMIPDRYYLRHPEDWQLDIAPVWQWVKSQEKAIAFLGHEWLPWKDQFRVHDPVVLTPILDAANAQPIGAIYIELRSLAQPWDRKTVSSLFPAVQSLAAQVASALHQAKIYAETLQFQATQQELEFAGKIQASFLPSEMPRMDGWELAVTLLPARETSGDYFDVIQLSDEKVGFLVADVTDKGLGAALYMALSRTLIRTYALEYEASPDIVFFSVNERILQDAQR